MKKLAVILLFSFLLFGLAGCADNPPAPGSDDNPPVVDSPSETELINEVRVYDIPEGVERYTGAEVTVNGEEIPVYAVRVNTSQNWVGSESLYERAINGVVLLELKGKATVVVKPNVQIDYTSKLRPLSARITPVANLEENTLSLTFKSAGEYVLEINGDTHDTITFFVSDYDTDKKLSAGYDTVLIFGAGLHTSQNSSYIDNNNTVRLNSNTLVVLEDGAVVRGRFLAENAENIAVVGRGIIDGSAFLRDTSMGTVTVPLEFNHCKDILLQDLFVLDPAGWCVNFYFVEDSRIDNIKIMSSRSNGDGISLQSCKNIQVDGCFLRTWDDSLVVKNYPVWADRSQHGETENITFTNCTIWTDLAQSMEIGYETVGETLQNVTFENITVLHALHQAVLSIHNANNAEIKDIVFRNITIEEANKPSAGSGILDFRVLFHDEWSTNHTTTALGNVDGVLVENLNILEAGTFKVMIGGCWDKRSGYESDHYVDNVTIRNIALKGNRLTESECRFAYTDSRYVRELTFLQEEDFTVTGAGFLFSQSEEELKKYGDKITVTIVK